MNKISVFGSTGFIGKKWIELYSKESFSEDRSSIKSENKDILYFRATNSNYNVFSDPSLDVKTNLTLLTELFKNIDSSYNFNLISSWFVYGKNNCEINKEIDYCNPKGFYSITKYTQEQLTESYCETNNIKYKILRLCNVIGGDQKATAKKNALEFLIDKLKKHEEINIYEGDNYRNYLNVEDVCKAIKLIIEKGKSNEIYNIGDTKSTKLIDIIDYCKNRLNSKSIIKMIETPKFHQQVQTKNFWMDTSKLQSLHFKPKYSLEETLNKLCK
ncbi:MAG: NAD(P)-dependent oxidoreductase [Caulobacteraceae bacterium]|nr:NAD(P)-dependent oxidoreductase [Caulobacteraceae bacterium]